jgi:5-methylcytosine-specific restriction endonuclease McrA
VNERAWGRGSTRAWRRTRLAVFNRDGWTCALCGGRIDPDLRSPAPGSAEAHHLLGKRYGDDPAFLRAAHRSCNLAAGNPDTTDAPARPATDWNL